MFTANSLGIFKFAGTSYFASDPAEPTAAPEVLAASAGDFAFAAQGALPADAAALSVTPIEAEQDELAEALCDFGVQLDGEGTIFAFDIKLLDALGAELQPVDGAVEISISGLPTDAPLRVIHRHHDVPALMSADARAARAVPAAPVEELPCALTGDTLTFSTTGFSEYYIVSGHATYEKNSSFVADGVIVDMSNHVNDTLYTLYVAPGTTIRFISGGWLTAYSWWKYDNVVNNDGHITVVGPSDEYSYTTDWGICTEVDEKYHVAEVKVSRDANVGETITLYNFISWETGTDGKPSIGEGSYTPTVTITVEDEMDVVKNTFNRDDNQYPVVLTILHDASDGVPSEPTITQLSYDYADSSLEVAQEYGRYFANCADRILDPNQILGNPNLLNSVDGTPTMGITRQNGVDLKNYLNGIEWGTLLKNAANLSPIAADGKNVTTANYEDYEIIPYVIKLQTARNLGWHIDCYIAAKNQISLYYVANLAPGYEVEGLNMPDTKIGTGSISTTVGSAKKGENNIIVGDPVQCKDSEKTVTFTGWNTAPDGSGTWYDPDDPITIYEDTTLYAQWKYTPELTTGTLKVQKIVDDPEEKLTTKEFTMTLTGVGKTNGKLYDYNGKLLDDDITSDSFTLEHGEYALFTLPVNSEVTVTETSTGDYTPSYDKPSVTIKQGATSTITVTNTYKAPTPVEDNITVNVTKTVSGTYGDVKKSFTLKVGYKTTQDGNITWLNENGDTFKVGDDPKSYTVPSGAYLVIEESGATGYTMTAQFGEDAAATQANNYVVTSPALTADTDVTVNNNWDAIPDTGVALDALPYALALAVAVVGAAMLLARPRRRRE